MSSQMYLVSVRNSHVWCFNQIKDITSVQGLITLGQRVETALRQLYALTKQRGSGNGESLRVSLLLLKSTYICYHFSPGLVPLPVVGPLLFLLQHALSCCAILQGKFAQDLAKAMNADLTHGVYRVAQEQQKGMKPADVQRNITSV